MEHVLKVWMSITLVLCVGVLINTYHKRHKQIITNRMTHSEVCEYFARDVAEGWYAAFAACAVAAAVPTIIYTIYFVI